MVFHIYDIQKNPEGIPFDQTLNVEAELMARNSEILAVSPITAVGSVRFEAGFYFLDYQLSYEITLASSRSMEPVLLKESYPVNEIFVADESTLKDKDLVDADLVLVIEDEVIRLEESVTDNILLNIPIKVLTPEEEAGEALSSGTDWAVMTEETYRASQQEKKEAASPFAQLQGLFDED
ncbi:DUF177 domain-containing protein [Streptococcus sp. X16XC17]|uniref:YceD family protein n=1 Tax=unclassified Streptococcus TaxID=2608887 RepID=UPI00066FCFBF|nr:MULTISPECIES: DUF177 domain-containing protein [unclassified Streptococcus]TCD46025.1 DUF177 domain-containing protein [Streptococcus sp. X16XC17]